MSKPTSIHKFKETPKGRNPIAFFRSKKNKKKDVETRREYIYNYLFDLLDHKINRLDCYRNNDIQKAIELYDELFFDFSLRDGYVYKEKSTKKIPIQIEAHIKEERIYKHSDEKPTYTPPASTNFEKVSENGLIEIFIYRKAFRKTFTEEQRVVSNSSRCFDRLECILQSLEHELIHVLIRLYDHRLSNFESIDNWVNLGHGIVFKKLLLNIFLTENTDSFLKYGDVDVYTGRTSFILKNIKEDMKIALLGRKGTFTITSSPFIASGYIYVKVKDDKGKITEEPIEKIEIKDKKRKISKKNTILSPISRK